MTADLPKAVQSFSESEILPGIASAHHAAPPRKPAAFMTDLQSKVRAAGLGISRSPTD